MRPELEALARELVASSYLKGDFLLRSGKRSNVYFDKYLFETRPAILRLLGTYLSELLPIETEVIAAPELGAVLLGGAVSLETGKPLVLVRKEAKEYGTSKAIEGRLEKGQKVTIIEDVLTTGGEAIKAAQKVREAGGEVLMLIAVLDREEGAAESLARAGIPFHPLLRRADVIPS
jgi:orotate phosphoribosyltransferase